jgi:hypothetical protein
VLKETISLLVLALALNVMSAIVAGFGFVRGKSVAWAWLAVFAASLTAAVACLLPVYVAIRTGLYDFRGALLMAVAALAWQIAAWGFLRLSEPAGKRPPP